jgi:hypothetical protein
MALEKTLREAWEAAAPRALWSFGAVDLRWENAFWREHRSLSPYRSVRKLVPSLLWPPTGAYASTDVSGPSPIIDVYDYPNKGVTSSWIYSIQGVATDGLRWYFSAAHAFGSGGIYSFLVTDDLDDDDRALHVFDYPGWWLDGGYDHIGGISYGTGSLWLPVDHHSDFSHSILARWDIVTRRLAMALTTGQDGLPWCAIDAQSGLLFSSEYRNAELYVYDPSELKETEWDLAKLPTISAIGRFSLKDELGEPLGKALDGIQAGVFTPQGHLLLAVQASAEGITRSPPLHTKGKSGLELPNLKGIMAFDMFTGRRMWTHKVDFEDGQELEGITVLDLDGRGAPGLLSGGQIHVNVAGSDGDHLWFKHFKIAAPGKVLL